eukprot:scpid83138/ scgid4918/ 
MASTNDPAFTGYLTKQNNKASYFVLRETDWESGEMSRLDRYKDKRTYQAHGPPKDSLPMAAIEAVAFVGKGDPSKAQADSDDLEGDGRALQNPQGRFVISLKAFGKSDDGLYPVFAHSPEAANAWISILKDFSSGKPCKHRLGFDHVWHGVEVMQLGDIWNTVSKVRAPHSLLLNREGLALALPRRKDPIFCCPHSAIRRVSSQDKHLVVEFGTSASCGEGRLFLLPPSGESTAEYIFRMINSQQRSESFASQQTRGDSQSQRNSFQDGIVNSSGRRHSSRGRLAPQRQEGSSSYESMVHPSTKCDSGQSRSGSKSSSASAISGGSRGPATAEGAGDCYEVMSRSSTSTSAVSAAVSAATDVDHGDDEDVYTDMGHESRAQSRKSGCDDDDMYTTMDGAQSHSDKPGYAVLNVSKPESVREDLYMNTTVRSPGAADLPAPAKAAVLSVATAAAAAAVPSAAAAAVPSVATSANVCEPEELLYVNNVSPALPAERVVEPAPVPAAVASPAVPLAADTSPAKAAAAAMPSEATESQACDSQEQDEDEEEELYINNVSPVLSAGAIELHH